MKKRICLVAALLALCLTACSSQAAAPAPAAVTEAPATPAPAPDLTGEWEQSNKDSESSYHAATITADTITIYWINAEKETKSLYWAGSFTPPADAVEPYTWESVNDQAQTAHALLAAHSDSKPFAYEGGEIVYEASAMGMTKTVRLQKIS